MRVIDAANGQLEQVAAIYAEAAATLPATFDTEGPPLEWWREVMGRDELLVALEGDAVLGFAKSGSFKDRRGYDTTREVSAYVHPGHRGAGVGRALYAELLPRLEADPERRMAVAGVTQPNAASDALHRSCGFTEVGVFHDAGRKFGRMWSVRWYERPLSGGAACA